MSPRTGRSLVALTILTLTAQVHAEENQPRLARPPSLLRIDAASVPAGTRFERPEVEVLVELTVDETGKVTAAKIARGVGEPFDSAALVAARAARFEPARLTTGAAVAVSVSLSLTIKRPGPASTPASRPIASRPPPPPPPVRMSGELLERGTRRALVAVEVVARAGGRIVARAVSDERGRFSLSVPAARFELVALPAGHRPLRAPVSARPGEEREERFYLEASPQGFETLIETDRVRREVTRQVLPKALVERIPGTAGDTLKVVQILPGVARSGFDSGALILRGSSPGDSRIFLEGQQIPILYHFGGLRSSFNSAFLESVTFVPGNFGPEYGRATGGIVDLKVRDPARDAFRGALDLNLYDAGIVLEGPISKSWSIGGAFRRSYIDSILPAVLPDDAAVSFDTAPRYYDYQLLASYRPSARESLRLIAYGSLDKIELLFARPQSDPAIRGDLTGRIMFHNLYAGYRRAFSDRLSQETSLQIGAQQFRTVIGPELFFDLDVIRFSARSSWSLVLNRALTARAGLDLSVERAALDLSSPLRPLEGESLPPLSTREVYGFKATQILYEPALFLELEARPSERLTLIPSLRLDWARANRSWTLDPRLSARYQLARSTVLKGALGSYHQPPEADQTSPSLGNPALRTPISMHASGGVEQRLFGFVDVELTGFYKWLDSLVTRDPRFGLDPAAAPYRNGGTGRIFGLELLVRARLGDRFLGWAAYTFQRSYRRDRPDAPERLFDFDQPHLLTLVSSVRIGRGWSAGLRFRLVSGSPYTPVVGALYDARADVYIPQFGPSNSARRATFHQLDLRVDKVFTFQRWKLSAYLDIQNVYNQRNQEGLSYSFDYRESEPVTGLPILPILGVKGEW